MDQERGVDTGEVTGWGSGAAAKEARPARGRRTGNEAVAASVLLLGLGWGRPTSTLAVWRKARWGMDSLSFSAPAVLF